MKEKDLRGYTTRAIDAVEGIGEIKSVNLVDGRKDDLRIVLSVELARKLGVDTVLEGPAEKKIAQIERTAKAPQEAYLAAEMTRLNQVEEVRAAKEREKKACAGEPCYGCYRPKVYTPIITTA